MDTHISEPSAINADAMKRIAAVLRQIELSEEHCAARLGRIGAFPDFAGSQLSRPYLRERSDLLDIAIALFLLHEKVPIEQACKLFGEADLETLHEMALVQTLAEWNGLT